MIHQLDPSILVETPLGTHYEIASYGTLRQFAETLGLTKAVTLLEATLNEEKAADEKLSEVAQSINVKAEEEVLESKSR